ncbi:right-handed parallel beta-helix repeat-containing protein [Nocardioides insulae]|uniref:right-handed parallel beta-helix repeat-containing protein n=1 Tax=Nocardioides insulae TaxID=394734 RepID=UPI00146F5DE0|nr:right-handed parallel beta-helix repeat-containing protein [Nocardioides insulae]
MPPVGRPLVGLVSGALLAAVLSGEAAGETEGPGPAAAATREGGTAPRPATTWHVSGRGADSASGRSGAPWRRLGTAVRRARSGDRIVVHTGTYHESVTVPRGKRLQIRTAPRARAWLDGSRVVRGWHRTAHGASARWLVELDSSPTYHRGEPDGTEQGWTFVNPAHPMAAHPDQVWIAGREQRQVGSLAQLRPGTFLVDDRRNRLQLGSDPRGRTVRASTFPRALRVLGAGTQVRGLGVRRFAPSVPDMGAVVVEARGVVLSRMRIRDNATTGLHVTAPRATVHRVRLVGNGMLGMSATYADRLRMLGVLARRNNTERFNTAPVAGGVKIGRSRHLLVRGGRFAGNAGTGLWFDESSYRITVVGAIMRRNARHGLALELSTRALVADTVIARNRGHGIKVNNTARVRLWNNTIVRNGRAVNIVQDDRRLEDLDTPGHDPRRPSPDPTMSWVSRSVSLHNNILGGVRYGGNCVLCVEDYSGRFSAEQLRIRASGNVYLRPRRSAPAWAVVWSRGAGDPAVFRTVRRFRTETGRERRHLDLIGVRALTPGLRARPPITRRTSAVAVPLAGGPARALHRPAGTRHLGAW